MLFRSNSTFRPSTPEKEDHEKETPTYEAAAGIFSSGARTGYAGAGGYVSGNKLSNSVPRGNTSTIDRINRSISRKPQSGSVTRTILNNDGRELN